MLKKILTILTLSLSVQTSSLAAAEYAQEFELSAFPVSTPHLVFKTEEEMGEIVLKPYVSVEDIYQLTIMHLAIEENQFDIAGPIALDLAKAKSSRELAKMASALYSMLDESERSLEAAALWRSLDSESEEAHLNYLIVAGQAGEYDGLTEELKRRLAKQIVHPEMALAEVADFLRRLNQPQKALEIFQELVSEQAQVQPGLINMFLSDFAMYAGQEEMAWSNALKALNDKNLNPEVGGMAAMRLLQLSEGPRNFQALHLVSQYIEANPTQRAVRLFYAHVLTRDKKFDLALTELAKMNEQNPEDFDLLYYRAQVEYQAGNLHEAVAYLEQYLSVQEQRRQALPDNRTTAQASATDAYFLMAKIYEELGEYQKGIEQLALIDEPQARYDVLTEQASLYIKLKSYTQAHALLEQIQPEDDEDVYVRALLMNATLSRERGEYAQGLEYVERALKYYPNNLYIRYSQAMMFEHMGEVDRAVELLEQILLDYPYESESYNGLGYVLADNNLRLNEAQELIERALAMSPDSVHIQDSYGWVNFRLGNLVLAKNYLEMAWNQEPMAEVAAHLADVHYALEEKAQAYEYLQKGYELDSEDRALLATIERLGYEVTEPKLEPVPDVIIEPIEVSEKANAEEVVAPEAQSSGVQDHDQPLDQAPTADDAAVDTNHKTQSN
ncbi:MAG: tetratricopeptide repeat protein [Alcaligenaceae bacterium]|nr:tetratricopeptide repeat protein [Alcaligenaceae bacterium]